MDPEPEGTAVAEETPSQILNSIFPDRAAAHGFEESKPEPDKSLGEQSDTEGIPKDDQAQDGDAEPVEDEEEIEVSEGVKEKVSKAVAGLIAKERAEREAAVRKMHDATREAAEAKRAREPEKEPEPEKVPEAAAGLDDDAFDAELDTILAAAGPTKGSGKLIGALTEKRIAAAVGPYEGRIKQLEGLIDAIAGEMGKRWGDDMLTAELERQSPRIDTQVADIAKEYNLQIEDAAAVREIAKGIAGKQRRMIEDRDIYLAIGRLEGQAASPPSKNGENKNPPEKKQTRILNAGPGAPPQRREAPPRDEMSGRFEATAVAQATGRFPYDEVFGKPKVRE